MAGFNTAVTGLKAAQIDLDVTGNNIANASTVGFKSSRTEFGDIYATAVVGAGSANVAGSGVSVVDIAQDFQAGTIEFTNNNLDLAINGSGFFQLDDGQGGTSYSRAGSFELDKDGFIVSKTGKHLKGFGLDPAGNRLPLRKLAVDQKESPPHATENIAMSFNIDSGLDSSKLAAVYDRNNANSYSYTTTVQTFDSLGNPQSIKFNFAEQRPVREVYQFSPANGPVITYDDPLTALDETALNTDVSISDVPVTWEVDTKKTSDYAVDSSVYIPDKDTRDLIEAKDPRIDVSTIAFYWTETGIPRIDFEFHSDSSGTGDIIVTDAGTELEIQNLNDGLPATRTANEIQSFKLIDTNFDEDTGKLLAETNILVGGVTISLDTDMSIDDVGEAITNAQQKIREINPDIKAVQYNASTNTVFITWNAEAGDVEPLPITATVDKPAVAGFVTAAFEDITVLDSDSSDPSEITFDGVTLTLDDTSGGGTAYTKEYLATEFYNAYVAAEAATPGSTNYTIVDDGLGTLTLTQKTPGPTLDSFTYTDGDAGTEDDIFTGPNSVVSTPTGYIAAQAGVDMLDDTAGTPASQKGDDSFQSVYRMYGYLNDTQQLNLGKRVDPGESGFTNNATEIGSIVVKFDTTTGVLSEINGESIISGGSVPKIQILGADPANPNDEILEGVDIDQLAGVQLDITGSSQFASESIVKASSQDGYTKGDLIGVTFEDTGEMVASFSNGQRQNLGLVAIATFENQNGLIAAGDTEWVASLQSGQAILNPPGTGLNGTLQSAALEQSNVDLSAELVALIEAQRNFQANSKTIETQNTITQNILQI